MLSDLLSEFVELLVLSLSASGVVISAVVGQLVDFERVIGVFLRFSALLQALDHACAHNEAIRSGAGSLLLCCCLHID